MKIFKNTLLFIILILAFAYTGYSFYMFSLDPCDKSVGYALGRFDSQFGVSQEEFKSQVAAAEKIWEDAIGKDVFHYDPDASLKINLIYDERQLATIQKQKTESGLSAVEDVLAKLDEEFNRMKSDYESKFKDHEAAVASFEVQKEDYADKVEYWNSKGGAPKGVYEELAREGAAINAEVSRLNNETSSINTMAKELNALLEKRNEAARNHNIVAEIYNKKYGEGLEFDQAEYTGKEINVYQFGNKKDLQLALTHEFGHALGMGHVDDSSSIMYYITGGNTKSKLSPSEADLVELNRVCSK